MSESPALVGLAGLTSRVSAASRQGESWSRAHVSSHVLLGGRDREMNRTERHLTPALPDGCGGAHEHYEGRQRRLHGPGTVAVRV